MMESTCRFIASVLMRIVFYAVNGSIVFMYKQSCPPRHEFINVATFITFLYHTFLLEAGLIFSHHDVLQGRPPGPQREGSSDLPDSLSPSLQTFSQAKS